MVYLIFNEEGEFEDAINFDSERDANAFLKQNPGFTLESDPNYFGTLDEDADDLTDEYTDDLESEW